MQPILEILWQADGVWAVNKPAGLPVHATLDWQRPHLMKRLARQLERELDDLILLHRLDVDTSGIVLVADRAQHTQWLARLQHPESAKVYWALTAPPPDDLPRQVPWLERNYLKSKKEGPKDRMVLVRAGGDRAESWMVLVAASGLAGLLQVRLVTGRRHQIRAQLGALGMPLVGDAWYGSTDEAARVMLHAGFLRVADPEGGPALELRAPLPQDWLEAAAQRGLAAADGADPGIKEQLTAGQPHPQLVAGPQPALRQAPPKP